MKPVTKVFTKSFYLLSEIVIILSCIDFTACNNLNQISIEFIEAQALKLKLQSFSEDQTFLQETNSVNQSTTYFYVDSANRLRIPVFIRNGSVDNGKSVVVLQQLEDRLPKCGNKATFVVLRQKEDQPKMYSAVIAYVTKVPLGLQIEWDSWDDRGMLAKVNKATLFGWTKCSYSSLIPCKIELQSVLPGNVIYPRPMTAADQPTSIPEDGGLDYFCDLQSKGSYNAKFVGSTIDTMINSMVILTGVQIIYQDEDKLVTEVAKDIKSAVPKSQVSQVGRSFFGNAKNPEALDIASEMGAKKLLEKGRESIASAVLMFGSSLSNIGAIAMGLSVDSIISKSSDLVQDRNKSLGQMSSLGISLLRGLFEGASTEDKDEQFINPNPKTLLKSQVVEDLISLKTIAADQFLGRLFGYNLWGSSSSENKSTIDNPINVKIGNEVVAVQNITGGILMNERYLRGTVVPGDIPGEFKFIPEGEAVPNIVNGSTAGVSPALDQPQGVLVNVSMDGQTVSVLAVKGGIMLNGKFVLGRLVQEWNSSETKFVSSDSSNSYKNIFAITDGKKGVRTRLKINGTEVDVIQFDDGIILNGKFIKGKIIKGINATDHQIIVPDSSTTSSSTMSPAPLIPESSTPSPPASAPGSLAPPPTGYTPPSIAPPRAGSPGDSSPPKFSETPNTGPGKEGSKPPIAYIFYIDNSTSSPTPLVAYIAPHGFLFYGLFFPGRAVDLYYIEISGQLFRAEPIERSKIRRGLMFPPMPSVYVVNVTGDSKVAYFVGNGFLTETFFIPGKVVDGGVLYRESFYSANLLPAQQATLLPAMAGAFIIEIHSKHYLAYVVNQGVLIGGSFFPAKILSNGIEIKGKLYIGAYLNYLAVSKHELYKVIYYYSTINFNMSTVLGETVEGCVEFSEMYIKITALLREGNEVDIRRPPVGIGSPPVGLGLGGPPMGVGIPNVVQTGVVAPPPTIINCPPGQRISLPLGLSAEVAQNIMQRDFVTEMIDWRPHMKTGANTGSKAADNLVSIFKNSFDWGGQKSAGQTFQENLISGLWTPFGLVDDLVDAIGYVTGAGKVSDDYGYIDDLFGVVLAGASTVGGVAGKIIDGVGFVLNPIGLGGVWKTVAGIASGAVGIVGGVKATEVYGVYDLVKVGAKTVHLGWLLGLRGSESEKRKKELAYKVTQLQSVRTYLLANPPQCSVTPVGVVGVPQGTVEGAVATMGSMGMGVGPSGSVSPVGEPGVVAGAVASVGAKLSAGLSYLGSFRGKRSATVTENSNAVDFPFPVTVTDADLFSHMGWRTIHIKQDSLSNFQDIQEEPFVGIGACTHKMPTEVEFNEAKSPKELLEFYMRSMGTQCLSTQREALMGLIKFKHILLTSEKTFVINKELVNKKKLTSEEAEILSKGFEISTYSKTYLQILNSKTRDKSKANIAFLHKFVANYMNEMKATENRHYIKLTRSLIKTLQTLFTKSVQDFYRFKYCPKCHEDIIRSLMNDPLEILSLLEFLAGFDHIGSGNTKMEQDYEVWISERREEMQKKLQLYFI